ncbi:hypothetical protein [Streptomyces sp. NPDC056817]|uniref:hypothetical protein n=1 Tax=Streptomyces sp. NPDC056817 TaxID=3345950 RepID=UPI0036A460B2
MADKPDFAHTDPDDDPATPAEPTAHLLSDADLLAWAVVMSYRARQERDGMKLLLLPYPPCPTCGAPVDEAKQVTLDRFVTLNIRLTLWPCGHIHETGDEYMRRLWVHTHEMLSDVSSGYRGHAQESRSWTTDEIVREARARVDGTAPEPDSAATEPAACDSYQPPTTPAETGLCARCGMYDYKHRAEPASSPLREQLRAALTDDQKFGLNTSHADGRAPILHLGGAVDDVIDAVLAVIDPHGDNAAALERGHRCLLENHDKRLRNAEEALTARRGMVSGAEAAVARVRAEVARIRAVTRTWGPVADLIDAALDGIGQPREQRERPAHPDGTPYSYAEMVAEGWGFCDGCRMWSTATAERPHQCTGTHMQGPVVGTARITVDVPAPKSADLADAVRTVLDREARLARLHDPHRSNGQEGSDV